MMRAKIHRATVTKADLNYNGSITIDSALLKATDILPYEKVSVVNINTGARFETYVIEGRDGGGEIQLNGAAARLVCEGDKIIVIAYAMLDDKDARGIRPKIALVDDGNRLVELIQK